MADFLLGIGDVLTASVGYIGTVTTALISNEIFQLVAGFVVLGVIVGLVLMLLSKIKVRTPRK